MIKNPIQEVTNKLQYRAIGIVRCTYKPNNIDQLNRGTLTDKDPISRLPENVNY